VAERDRIGRESCENVFVELFHIDEDGSADCWSEENGCPKGGRELFLGEHGSEIVWVDLSVVPIPLFWVDEMTLGKDTKDPTTHWNSERIGRED